MDSRGGLNTVAKRMTSVTAENDILICLSSSALRKHYTDKATRLS